MPSPTRREHASPPFLSAARSPHHWSLTADAVLGSGIRGVDSVVHARVYEPHPPDDQAAPVIILAEFGDHVGRSITNGITEAAAAAQARFYPDGRQMRVVLMYPHAEHAITHPLVAPLLLREIGFHTRRRRSALRQWWARRRAQREQQQGGPWEFTVTEVSPDGATRHVLPGPEPDLADWHFTGTIRGRELRLEVLDADQSAVIGPVHDVYQLRWSRPAAVRVPALLGDTELDTWPRELYTAELIGGPQAGAYAAHRYNAVHRRVDALGGIIDALADPPLDTFTDLGGTR